MRRSITTLFAIAGLAVAALAASSVALPSPAQAAACAEWQLPIYNDPQTGQYMYVNRSDGWELLLRYPQNGYWRASGAVWRNGDRVRGGLARFSSVTADLVKFNIRWPNEGLSPVFTGTIRSDGYVSGVMVERTGSGAVYRTHWFMSGRARCVR
jgi:hypothetical protein